jgi:type I restriction enzyme R subunit
MDTEQRRESLYKLTILLMRAYATIADEMSEAGYSTKETENIKADIKNFTDIRKAVQVASGDYIDLKQYEPAMRYLIDSYIGAEESKVLANFDNMSLVELLVEKGKGAVDALPEDIRRDKEATAEVIENNMRRVIIEERPTNPLYYDKMSVLLDEIIRNRKEQTEDYASYLKKIIELSNKVKRPESTTDYPKIINTPAKRALYDNLEHNVTLANELDSIILSTIKDGWKDNIQKTRAVEHAICEVLERHEAKEKDLKNILEIVRSQKEY